MDKLKSVIKNELFKGTFIVFLGSGFSSFLNYLYHVITGRLLIPNQYGLLESFITLTYFIGIFTQAFSFAVINLIGKTKKSLISSQVKLLEKKALSLSLILWLLLIFSFPFFKKFLHLPNFLVFFIFSLQLLFSFLPAVYLATLQARLKFVSFSLIAIVQSTTKTLFTFILIFLGFKTKGALAGFIISGLVGFFISRGLVKKHWPANKKENKKIKISSNFLNFSLLSVFTNLGLASIYSTDILLVRYYLSSLQSGIYSAVSVLGKIIYFAATLILLVSFPLFIKYKNDFKKLQQTLKLSLLFLTAATTFGIIIFKSFPLTIVNLLYGEKYQQAIIFIPIFAIFISLYAIFTCVIQFLLALEKKSAAFISLTTALAQIILIVNLHFDLRIIIKSSILSISFGLLLSLFFVIKALNGTKK